MEKRREEKEAYLRYMLEAFAPAATRKFEISESEHAKAFKRITARNVKRHFFIRMSIPAFASKNCLRYVKFTLNIRL